MLQPPFAPHDHQGCVDQALARAQELCAEQGVSLTAQRRLVLRLIWQSHKPLGAYPLMALLETHTGKRVAPPTVYRALEFLLEQGLIHRVHSLNAFIGCSHPGHRHAGNLLICRDCGEAQELDSREIGQAIEAGVAAQGFVAEQLMLEIVGVCHQCRNNAP
jgi:Fur family transcriptional regulator, zinc uptake regulator